MLAILVMTLLGLNPWPLLVSFSTVMVSFAFSFGPSCAKYIEVRSSEEGQKVRLAAGS